MLESWTMETFDPLLNQIFKVRIDDESAIELTLIEVSAAKGDPSARRKPFALLFQGPAEPGLAQALQPFEHDTLGTFDMFIVPVAKNDTGFQYEAVFN